MKSRPIECLQELILTYRWCTFEQMPQSIDSSQKFDIIVAKCAMDIAHNCVRRESIRFSNVLSMVNTVTLFLNGNSNF